MNDQPVPACRLSASTILIIGFTGLAAEVLITNYILLLLLKCRNIHRSIFT